MTRSAGQTDALIDSYGRRATSLRISVTDRCNFRCTYCMPEGIQHWLPRQEVLTFDEIERVAAVCINRFGVNKLRLTGGEPTVRADLPVLVAKLSRLAARADHHVDIAMTTNGATLSLLAAPLRKAGLQRLNISLDTLRRDRFHQITGQDRLGNVLEGIEAARLVDYRSIKINTVVMSGVNDDEVVDLATFARERSLQARFIEFMPLDGQGRWNQAAVVRAADIVEMIDAVYPLDKRPREGSGPADIYSYRDGRGEVGIIASVTQPFCASCDRIRLTAEGKLRTCLFAHDEYDLRDMLRNGANDDRIAERIKEVVLTKWAGHQIGRPGFIQPVRLMHQIGG
ncbi:MAG: GTP 3',8-cyclase MoaA [Actinobacteria bacterium]|nr:GTP 3',8-cyclase MoaA [Actinomycetota bacterium]